MKNIILILLLFLSITAMSVDHFVKGDGSADFSTIAQVNAHTFLAGDRIFFNRGETFTGTLIIGQSGSVGNPIIYGAYGTGANPIITGFINVTSWTNLGSNIWESTNSVSTLDSCIMVTIGGVNTPMGRTPNLNNYYTLQSHNANLSITSSNLTGTPNWTGAEVVIRKTRWTWQVGQITAQSGATITYDDAGVFSPHDDWGFFIQDDSRTLDVQNEWYYNSSTKKIKIYSTSQPTNVKVASSEYVVDIQNKNYTTIENLTLDGANTSVVNIYSGSYNHISGCTINHGGLYGINFTYNDYSIFNANTVKNCGWSAIGSSNYNTYETITNNIIDSTCMILGVGLIHTPGAINIGDDNTLIQYNIVDHSGYNGIYPTMDIGAVRNNFVNNSLLNRSDGGGIYTAGTHTKLIIDGNIVLNTKGYAPAADASLLAKGIYLDMPSINVVVSNNTCAFNAEDGIFVNYNSTDDSIIGNTSFGNSNSQYRMNDYRATELFSNIVLMDNYFISSNTTQYTMSLQTSELYNTVTGFITASDNNVFARPAGTNTSLFIGQQNTYSGGLQYKNTAQWQTFSGLDSNSNDSPITVASTNDLFFAYNATSSPVVVNLPYTGIDVKSVRYGSTATLPAWGSLVIAKDLTNPTPSSGQKPSRVGNGKIGVDRNGNPLYTN